MFVGCGALTAAERTIPMTRMTTHNLAHAAALSNLITLEGFVALWWVQGSHGCIITTAPSDVVSNLITLMGGV
jgi:hypothetical protein